MQRPGDSEGAASAPGSDPSSEADRWVVRRLDATSWSAEDERALRAWLAESPRHAEEFRRAEEALGVLQQRDVFAPAEIERLLARSAPPERPPRSRRAYWAATLAAAAVLLIFAVLYFTAGETFTTGVGERRTVVLPDGTRAQLDAGTRLQCRFSKTQRQVVLKTGGVVFQVAEDSSSTFAVRAGGCLIRDIGTTFDVHLRTGMEGRPPDVAVAVSEGVVEVHSTATEDGGFVRVVAGEQMVWNGEAQAPLVGKTATGQFAAWREGRLHYRDRPLVEVLGDLQRYSPDRLVLADAELGRLAVTGTLRTENLEDALVALRFVLPLRVRREAGRVLIEREAVRP
jgi:transmembrane sensor